jgi:predicted metal-dependent phosphoesterase TrpH
MTVRSGALLLLGAGLTAGSMVDRPLEHIRAREDGQVVLTADLHVHAFPGDGVLPAWELRKEANRRGLDVIVITNHNQSTAASLPVGPARDELPLVIPGQEITSPEFHLVAAGVRRVIDWRLPARDAITAVHAQGGIAIAAHPIPTSWRVHDPEALRILDGAEAMHPLGEADPAGGRELLAFYQRARERNPDLAPIGSSDFHGSAPLGRCRTYIVADDVSEAGVLSAIRRGRTVASGRRGELVGEPHLVELARRAAEARTHGVALDALGRIAVGMVLSALVLLIWVK